MTEPKFSICLITKNESKTLPRLVASLKDFQSRGGEIIVVDTGSNDNTPEIARSLGCKVEEVSTRFLRTLTADEAIAINNTFVDASEQPIVTPTSKFFHFANARNYCASLAKNDMISCADADEIFTKLDIDRLDQLIVDGLEQFEYNFVYAHDEYGNEALKFVQCKMYDRRKMKWVNGVHEVLEGNANRMFLQEDIFKLEHFQIPAEHRGNYLSGLAIDCYSNLQNDRNSHYLAREMMYCGRHRSAIKEFKRHISMDKWHAERAQSYIFMGDCYAFISEPALQIECYNKAFYVDGSRREALIKIARFFKHNNQPQLVLVYTHAAMQIPWSAFYANDKGMYEHEPHELLYWAYGWLGNIEQAQHHILKALEFRPFHSDYMRDVKFYFPPLAFNTPKISIIVPQLGRPEGLNRLIRSIKQSLYPQYLIQTIVVEGPETVPKKVAIGLKKALGEYVIYAANDTEFLPDSISIIVGEAMLNNVALLSFDTGVRNKDGYICEHFMIRKDFVKEIDGEIFDTEFHHVGVDDLLWHKCAKKGQAMISSAKMLHHHFSRIGNNIVADEIIQKGWMNEAHDRELLKQKLTEVK